MSTNHPEAQWFKDARFGIMFCLCPSAVAGIEMSHPLKKRHLKHMKQDEYEALADELTVENYNPDKWAVLAKEAGVRYGILTAKHHDGYCLWDTSTRDYSAPKTGPGRDLVGPYVEAFRGAGLKVGLYWSPCDWHDPDFPTLPSIPKALGPLPYEYSPERWERFHRRSLEQIRELLTNYGHIDLFWFDVSAWSPDRWRSKEIVDMMRSLQPHIVMNNRMSGVGDYATPEEFIPLKAAVPGKIGDRIPCGYYPQKEPLSDWWETCSSIHRQWAYSPDDTRYKSPRRILRMLAECASKGGNLCLGVGIKPDGTLPGAVVERLSTIADWMSHSSESIFADKGPDPACFYGPVTQRGNTLYLHVLSPPKDDLHLVSVTGNPGCYTSDAIARVRLLKTGEELALDNLTPMSRRFIIRLPEEKCDELDTVVAVEFKNKPKIEYAWMYREHGAQMVLPPESEII